MREVACSQPHGILLQPQMVENIQGSSLTSGHLLRDTVQPMHIIFVVDLSLNLANVLVPSHYSHLSCEANQMRPEDA